MDFCGVFVIAALSASAQARPAAVYSNAIDKYVARDFSGAADTLASLPKRDVQKEVEALAGVVVNSGEGARKRVEAAAMLHTEYAMLEELDNPAVVFHIDMAHLLLAFDRGRRSREVLPRWYALSSSVLLLRGLEREARALVDEGVKLFPDDPRILFRQALVTEFHAVWSPPGLMDPHPELAATMRDADGTAFDRSYSVRVWGPSEAAYRRVLAVDPGNDEAHLHLGFTLFSLRRSAEAQSELEAARDRAVDPYIVCLAHLFLARLRERESDAGGAAQEYERALAAAPFAQSAYMALSLLEERRGNPQRARELIGKFVAIPMRERVEDPWWGYHTNRVPVDDLQWLRTWVRE